ncbi:MAG: NAD(P)H-hydrate dehydratase [Myxococcota bacterium]|nr:NAD(P)H-hydrate dehydratase [Myxococcota bacterium]
MRALDAHTIDGLGVPGDLLMESAGRAVVEAVLALRDSTRDAVLVVCGSGNNGGDGLVVARQLFALGVVVRAVLLADPARLRGAAAANFARLQRMGVSHEVGVDAIDAGGRAGVVVDAIFGTGLAREVAVDSEPGRAIAAIERQRQYGARVVAVDVPSGLDSDTGQELGACVRADLTVTIGLPKCGLALEPGRSLSGRVLVARIGIADSAPGVRPLAESYDRTRARGALPARPRTGHKGRFGHVLLIAGSEGKTGAAALAARAAARAGAGLVTLACPAGLNDILETLCTEAMTVAVADTPGRGLSATAEESLLALARERDVVALGPGLGRDPDTDVLVQTFVKRCARPLVLDADGLNALGGDPSILAGREAATVLTPHPGEAARLLATTPAALNGDRLGAARELARRARAIVVLKGAPTVTATSEGFASVNTTGGPALGTAGTGDVLTGIVAALVGQGVAPSEAGALAAWLHGSAGDRITAREGDAGLLASELADALPATLRDLREAAPDVHSRAPASGLLLDFAGS